MPEGSSSPPCGSQLIFHHFPEGQRCSEWVLPPHTFWFRRVALCRVSAKLKFYLLCPFWDDCEELGCVCSSVLKSNYPAETAKFQFHSKFLPPSCNPSKQRLLTYGRVSGSFCNAIYCCVGSFKLLHMKGKGNIYSSMGV